MAGCMNGWMDGVESNGMHIGTCYLGEPGPGLSFVYALLLPILCY